MLDLQQNFATLRDVETPTHIAAVDDESDVTELIGQYLSGYGFRVTQLHSGAELLRLMASDPPQLVLLDVDMPGEDGFTIARELREHHRCGLIIVTGHDDTMDKIVGLEVGADDYMTKPPEMRELLARVKAVLRRREAAAAPAAHTAGGTTYRFAGWTLEASTRRLLDEQGAETSLTTGEFELLLVLVENAGRVLSRDFLLERTHGRKAGPFDRTIDVQVARLRKKIEVSAEDPQILKSVRNAGYVLVPAVQRN